MSKRGSIGRMRNQSLKNFGRMSRKGPKTQVDTKVARNLAQFWNDVTAGGKS